MDDAASAKGWPYGDRLPFVLPDFTRIAWTSAAAKDVWEPRLARIAAAWFDIQWLSVAAGVRRCALVRLAESTLLAQAPRWFERGLMAAPLGLEADTGLPYRSTSAPYSAGAQALVCAAVGRPDAVDAMRGAWARRDADAIGDLLGYPACCRRFFDAVWTRAQCVDTTWAMALGDGAAADLPDATRIDVTGPPGANVLLRWIGVRKVPHLPCGFACAATQALADRLDRVGRDAGHGEALAWIDETLSWPVEWSALHGIAEIKTPILKATVRSDATAGRRVVRRLGHAYPGEGARGLAFPYAAAKAPASAPLVFRRGIEHPLPAAEHRPDWEHRDNGFASRHGMDRLQAPIVALARRALATRAGRVLDLGCGNGILLQKICDGRPALAPFGIDMNREAIGHAGLIHPGHAANFRRGDLFDVDRHDAQDEYVLTLLMVGRLLDARPAAAARLLDVLQARCRMLLLYAYPDAGREPFERLVARAGLTLLPDAAGYAGLAAYPPARPG